MQYKPGLKLGFADYFSPMDEFFIDTLSKEFDVFRDDENPEYLIFCDENFGTSNNRFNDKNVIKIFFTGENRRPQNYHCHYAISFDHSADPRFYRLPLYVMDNWVQVTKMKLHDVRDITRNARAEDKTGFCSFIASNGGCQERNHMFHYLSTYKQIDSGGPLFNNIGYVLPRDGTNAQKTKFEFMKSRKFNLCYENGSYPGYVTEKLFHALYMGTIPIYWGSPTVEMDFNRKAFISRHDFESDLDMLSYIVKVDNNDDLCTEMLREPIMNYNNKSLVLHRFTNWFKTNVFKGTVK